MYIDIYIKMNVCLYVCLVFIKLLFIRLRSYFLLLYTQYYIFYTICFSLAALHRESGIASVTYTKNGGSPSEYMQVVTYYKW